jgi:hypothetical protein
MTITHDSFGGDSLDDSPLSRVDQNELDSREPVRAIELYDRIARKSERRDRAISIMLAKLVVYPAEREPWIRDYWRDSPESERIIARKLLELVHLALTTNDRGELLAGLAMLAAQPLDKDTPTDPDGGQRP